MLDFDFFEVLDSVTIARSRRHIEKYYSTTEIGKFPERLKPIARRPHLTDLDNAINYNDIYTILSELNLTVYTPSHFILPSKMSKYMDVDDEETINLTMQGREQGIRRLMAINLLKRLESSVFSFRLTLDRIRLLIDETIHAIEQYTSGECMLDLVEISDDSQFDDDDQNGGVFQIGKKVKIDLADMDYKSWLHQLSADRDDILCLLLSDRCVIKQLTVRTVFLNSSSE